MSSAFLYLGIVLMWLCVLVPMWLRRDRHPVDITELYDEGEESDGDTLADVPVTQVPAHPAPASDTDDEITVELGVPTSEPALPAGYASGAARGTGEAPGAATPTRGAFGAAASAGIASGAAAATGTASGAAAPGGTASTGKVHGATASARGASGTPRGASGGTPATRSATSPGAPAVASTAVPSAITPTTSPATARTTTPAGPPSTSAPAGTPSPGSTAGTSAENVPEDGIAEDHVARGDLFPAEYRRRARVMARRRRWLLFSVLLHLASLVTAAVGVAPWWSVAPSSVVLLSYLLILRIAVTVDAERRIAAAKARAEQEHRERQRRRALELAAQQAEAEIIEFRKRVEPFDQYADRSRRAVGD
ncbi:hypothetical protein [Sphaerisporangium perillae]|uniref:hypothetical protein n=1 Tax=Sphaerisporangium perillae TaxID=2935860 RepID=UPI00201081E8|nr:hypothetical protein [Sphaerisporangium perillae]